jgi:spermidine/putrescine transport system permease protein
MRERGRLAKAVLAVLLVVLYAPLVFLVVASVNKNPVSTAWEGFTTKWYSDALSDQSLRKAVGVSVRLSIGASVLAVVVGTSAVLAARRTKWFARLNGVLATVRVATPEIIIATGLGAVLPAVGVAFGFRPMLLAHVAYLSAYVVLIVGARAAGADRGLEEAALDLGAKKWQVLRDIVLPDLRPAMVSSALLAFAFSFDDVALSLALRGPNDTTVPIYIFSAVQRRVTPSIHAVGTLIIAVGIATFVAATVVHRAVAGLEARQPGVARP